MRRSAQAEQGMKSQRLGSECNNSSPERKTDETTEVFDPEFVGEDTSEVDPRKVLLKMDLHLIPMLALLYLLSFLDRGNIGNANIEGLSETLNMTGPQYNWTCMLGWRSSTCL